MAECSPLTLKARVQKRLFKNFNFHSAGDGLCSHLRQVKAVRKGSHAPSQLHRRQFKLAL